MPLSDSQHTPIQTKSDEPSGSSLSRRAKAAILPPDVEPSELMSQIRQMITDNYPEAQRLAAVAAARFPDDAEIRNADKILNGPTGPVGTAPAEPSTDEEFEWLRNPPASVRGKWVALSGKELLATAEKLGDLMNTLRAQQPRKRALVHHVE